MHHRHVGPSGLRISVIGLGTQRFGGAVTGSVAEAIIDTALELGINFIETADAYSRGGSEEVLGRCLGARRKNVVLASKFGLPMDGAGQGASRRYIMTAVEASLRRLRTDWIDLYQIHNPDPATPIEETLRALDDLIRQGKVRYIGHSNFAGWQTVEADRQARHAGGVRFISSQLEYSLLNRDIDREVLPAVRSCGLGLLPYLPLAAGMLTGRYRRSDIVPKDARLNQSAKAARYRGDAVWPLVDALQAFCTARDHSLLELAINWLLSRPNVCSIMAGVSTPEQLKSNVTALGWSLSPDDLAEIDRLTG